MKTSAGLILCLAFLTLCSCSNPTTWKLNVPRVLLPLSEGADFKLFSKGGCFTWKSTRPEVIIVTPIPDLPDHCVDQGSGVTTDSAPVSEVPKCSSSALVSISDSLYKTIGKTQAVVMAEDYYSPGRVLRADVIADTIRSLQIVTKTHELFLEEAPEEFAVRAYDDQGNEFSSLAGIIFKWNIIDKQSGNVKFIRFRDSSYALDRDLEEIEAKGLQGSKVLLEGIKTGSAKVSVRLASKAPYAASVPPTEVSILVVANLFIVPQMAIVMFGGTVNYHAEQIKSNKMHFIDLISSPQYFLEVDDNELVTVDVSHATVLAANRLGSTKVFLRDKNVELRTDLGEVEIKSPSADLHVVEPDHISIEIEPFKSWIVLVGNQYELSVDIFDGDNRKLFPSSNLVVKLEFLQQGYFEIRDRTENGTWISGTPLKSGNVQVKATLLGTKQNGQLVELAVPLTATALLEIYDQIELYPPISVFPWDPLARTSHQVMFTINGGVPASSYIWSSSNTTLSTVTQNGVAKAKGHLIGETVVTAAMNRAVHNTGTAIIRVAPALSLDIIDDHVREAEVGKQLSVPVAFFASESQPFSDCAGFPYDFQLNDQRSFSISNKGPVVPHESLDSACTTVTLAANAPGFTNVRVSYSYASLTSDKPVVLSDEATIAGFNPLVALNPESGSALLAIGSSYHVVWTGGPQPWIKEPRSHIHRLAVDSGDENIVSLSQRIQPASGPSGGNTFAFQITCQKVGQVDLVLSVGNEKSATLPRPVIVKSKVTIKCGEPDKLKLEAEVPQPNEQNCPLMAKTMGRIAALCYESLPILVSIFDKSGQKFDNISTFDIGWTISQPGLGSIPEKGVLVSKDVLQESGDASIVLGSPRAYQVLEPNGKPGQLEVTATLKTSGTFLIGGFGKISDTLSLNLVNDAVIKPENSILFNHPNNVQHLGIHHGSGFFDIATSSGSIIEHKYHVENQSVAVTPLVVGETTLTVKDLCLITKRQVASAKIQVTGIQTVELIVVDKLQQGKTVVAQVRLLDQQGQPIPQEQLKYLKVQLVPSTKQIVKFEEKPNSTPEELLFDVHGSSLGLTMLTAEVTYGQKQISSSPMPVQVFPPLSLEPRNITLIIGAKFQVQVVGGPHTQQDSVVEFMMGSTKIATSNSNGLISAHTLGSTKLVGKIYGVDKSTSKRIVFSEDTVNVHVVKLDGIKIRAPVHLVRSGTELPLLAVGTDGLNQNAFSFGSARPALHFHWTVSNQESGEIVSVFHRNGISQVNYGVARFIAKKPGRIVVKLRVSISTSLEQPNQFQLDRDREFQDEIEIKILESLNLRSPPLPCSNVVQMTPHSEFQLQTNRDFAAGSSVTYKISRSGSDSNIPDVTVDKNGLLTSGQLTGTCLIHVEVSEGEYSGVIQHTSVLVHVKPVKFVMLNVLQGFNPVHQSKSAMFLPKGITLGMELSYHDDLAVRFDAVHDAGSVQFRPSRFESNQITNTNHTSSIELVRMTETVLRATHSSGQQDFIIFDVKPAIFPNVKKVTAGDVIILQSSVTSEVEKWMAEPKGVISVNNLMESPGMGLALALRGGQGRISYQVRPESRITLDLEVEPASRISFNKTQFGNDFHLTNVPAKAQLVYLNIQPANTNGDQASAALASNWHVPTGWTNNLGLMIPSDLFHCHASFMVPKSEFQKLFRLTSVFDTDQGSYACKIEPLSDELVKMLYYSGDVELSVRPGQSLLSNNPNVQGDLTTLKFISTFKVKSESVEISNVVKRGEIFVQGLGPVLDSITATVSHPDLFYVGRSYAVANGDQESDGSRDPSENIAIPVSIKSGFWKSGQGQRNADVYVDLSDKKSRHTVRVPIRVVVDDKCRDDSDPGWSSVLGFMLWHYEKIVVAFICVFVTWIFAVKKSTSSSRVVAAPPQNPNRPTPFLNGSSPAANPVANPAHNNSNPGHLTNADNRPYLWTVDNSPIYGSPNGHQSPSFPYNNRRSPRPLAQYSYTDN